MRNHHAARLTILTLGAALLGAACGSGRKPARPLAPSHWNRVDRPDRVGPGPRYAYGMAFDDDRSRLVVFGGSGGAGATFADLWEWDRASATWTDHTPSPLPSAWPSARFAHALAYDAGRKRVLLFGGQLGMTTVFGDTWEWDPGSRTWTEVSPAGAPGPTPRCCMGLVDDAARGRVFMWGGYDEMGSTLDAWEWDGQARRWENRTPPVLPRRWPGRRDGHGLVYAPVMARVLLFGGFDGSYMGDLWSWDSQTGTWEVLTPTPLPPQWPAARHSAAVAFDPAVGRLVVFGGYDGRTRGDLWEWRPGETGWRDRTPAPLPPRWPSPRYGAPMAWDRSRGKLLLFGGAGASGIIGEVWEWDGS